MPKKKAARTARGTAGGRATFRAYTSPSLVLLALDWPDGKNFKDFLGFAILRSPGFKPGEKDGYLLNKIGFAPPGPYSQSLPSNVSPIQKFLWWDSAVRDAGRAKVFTYTVTPVRGTGPNDLRLVDEAASPPTKVTVPSAVGDDISTWFNRAVVSSQSFQLKFPDPAKDLDNAMAWLANGLEGAFKEVLNGASRVSGAIYHLTDKEWVVPALKSFKGDLALVYQDRPNDTTSIPAIKILKAAKGARFQGSKRSKTNIMHDKFLVDQDHHRLLMGSANFTPEGLTSQANLLHIFNSKGLSDLFVARQKLLAGDPSVSNTAKGAAWSKEIPVGNAKVRVIFSPEPTKQRESIDRVVRSIKAAKESVIFCLFDPTDADLISSLLAVGDAKKLCYGLLNAISTPKRKDNLSASGEAPQAPTAATQIKVTLYNRSRRDKAVLAYNYFRPGTTPSGFLPELNAVDMSSRSTVPRPKTGKPGGGPPAVHIHHKFIVVDPQTENPIIYTGSNNLSNNSTHRNDENLLEITGSPELAQTYLAEFMRLYEHYRARALWNMNHPPAKGKLTQPAAASSKLGQTFTLRTARDAWVKGAYKAGTPEYLARRLFAPKT
jgi:phosphatidylserine/phosphatidylglycerophosphate/cardiolipin synthase-like enzyme